MQQKDEEIYAAKHVETFFVYKIYIKKERNAYD